MRISAARGQSKDKTNTRGSSPSPSRGIPRYRARMDSEQPSNNIWQPSHAGAALRGLVAKVADGSSGPVYIGEAGQPQAVLLSYATFVALIERLDDADAALILQARLASAPPAGQGLSTEDLIAAVEEAEATGSTNTHQ